MASQQTLVQATQIDENNTYEEVDYSVFKRRIKNSPKELNKRRSNLKK